MNTLSRFFLLVLPGWILISTLPLQANPALSESAKIEQLIKHVENLEDAVFIRNGSKYSAANAAKFLRGKRDAHADDARTAEDFIAKLASASSTSGKPYLIRFKDGTEKPCGDVLKAQLKKLEGAK